MHTIFRYLTCTTHTFIYILAFSNSLFLVGQQLHAMQTPHHKPVPLVRSTASANLLAGMLPTIFEQREEHTISKSDTCLPAAKNAPCTSPAPQPLRRTQKTPQSTQRSTPLPHLEHIVDVLSRPHCTATMIENLCTTAQDILNPDEFTAWINQRDVIKRTPLQYAATKPDPTIIQILLKYGARQTDATLDGNMPLHEAVVSVKSPHALARVEFLLKNAHAQHKKDNPLLRTLLTHANTRGQTVLMRTQTLLASKQQKSFTTQNEHHEIEELKKIIEIIKKYQEKLEYEEHQATVTPQLDPRFLALRAVRQQRSTPSPITEKTTGTLPPISSLAAYTRALNTPKNAGNSRK